MPGISSDSPTSQKFGVSTFVDVGIAVSIRDRLTPSVA